MMTIVSHEKIPLSCDTSKCATRSTDGDIMLLPLTPRVVTESEYKAICHTYPTADIRALPCVKKVARARADQPQPIPAKQIEIPAPPIPVVGVIEQLLLKPVSAIMDDIKEKEQLMDVDDFNQLLRDILEDEQTGKARSSLIKFIESKLEPAIVKDPNG